MRYMDDDEHDEKIKEELERNTIHKRDVERHSLKHHSDMHFGMVDEGY